MKPKDDLFLLIKSLSKTEKGYFTKFAQMHGGTTDGNYLKLYHLIEGMEAYDEVELKKTVAGTSLGKHLSVSKNYLFKFILRALSSFHRDNIPELQIYHLLAEERILRSRRIPVSPENQVNKAQAIARHFGETQFLPLTNWIKYDQNTRHAFGSYTPEEYEQWKTDFIATGENQLQEMQFGIFFMDVLRARSTFDVYKKTLDEIVIHPLLQKDPKHLSIKSRVTYWGIWDRYYKVHGKIKEHAEANQAVVTILELQPPEFMDKYAHLLINTMASLCAARIREHNETAVREVIAKLKTINIAQQVGLDRLKSRCETECELNCLRTFWKPGAFREFESKVSETIEYSYATEVPLNQGAIRFMLGVGLMMDGAPDRAIDYFNWLLNDRTFAVFDYYPYSWYWVILAHNEMGNKGLLPSLISSAQNTSKKRLTTRPTEKDLIKNLKSLAKAKTAMEEMAVFNTMHQELSEGSKTATSIDQYGYREILEWLAKKLGLGAH